MFKCFAAFLRLDMNDFLDVGETKFNLCSAFLALLHKIITLSPFFLFHLP